MLKVKSKSEIFREAWQMARDATLRWGGSARLYLAAALRAIYADLRKAAMHAAYHNLACSVDARSAKEVAVTPSVYEVMIAVNTPSTTIADQAMATVSSVVSNAVAKLPRIATKAFAFIKKLFDFAPVQEIDLG